MREFKVKAYHRVYKKVLDVIGITGLHTSDPRVQSQDTTMQLKDVDILLYTGETDSKNNRLFESDTVEISVKENKKDIIRTGRIVFENAQFKIKYEKPISEKKFQVVVILYPDWKSTTKIGNIYEAQEPS